MKNLTELELMLDGDVKNGVSPGFVYGIISDNDEYMGVVGYKQLYPTVEKVDVNTLYDIATLTKTVVTVTMISKMVDESKISLNDKVNKYLKSFKYDDICIYHLLTHTSGLPADTDSKDIVRRENILQQVFSMDKVYPTGEQVLYSDIGFILLGLIIEKVYNKSLDVIAKEEIFIPLEMTSTTYNPSFTSACASTEITEKRGIVKGIVHDEKACSLGGVAGHAGVFTCVSDLNNFVKMVLNDGIYNGKQFLSKEIIDLWFQDLVYEPQFARKRSLCWITGDNDLVISGQKNTISFSGFTGPSVSIDRDNKVGIVLLTNRVHPSRENKKLSSERTVISNEIYNLLKKTNVYNIESKYK